jgi:hypothetical protein
MSRPVASTDLSAQPCNVERPKGRIASTSRSADAVRLPEVSVRVPHRTHDRRQYVAKTRIELQKRQKRFVAEFPRRHGWS